MPSLNCLEDIINFQSEIREEKDLTLRTRKINQHTALFTLHGRHVIEYIKESTKIRASDQFRYSNEVNKLLFARIFGNQFNFDFNQIVKVEKEIQFEKIEQLLNEGYNISEIKRKFQKRDIDFFRYEMDVRIQINNLGPKKLNVETKIFTCPDQGSAILASHLTSESLHMYLSTRDYMGFITFANMIDAKNPEKPFKFPSEVLREQRNDWFLHLLIVDHRILGENKSSRALAEEMFAAIKEDHQFFLERLGLNRYSCSIKLIENYVKVVHMSYLIEELEEKLEEKSREVEEKSREVEEKSREVEEKSREIEELIKFMRSKNISEQEINELIKSMKKK